MDVKHLGAHVKDEKLKMQNPSISNTKAIVSLGSQQ